MPQLNAVLLCCLVTTISAYAHAQPTVVSPEDVARFQQSSTVADNLTDGPAYDLTSPVELHVHILRVFAPEEGYATLVFRITDAAEGSEAIGVEADKKYIATLQLSEKFQAKMAERGLDDKRFSNGLAAVLYAWPATSWNTTNSAFLVDELLLVDSNRRLVFHAPNDHMIKHPNTTGVESD